MSYIKQNFTDGQVLMAEMLNKIESGIIQNETELTNKQPKGDYISKTDADNTYQPKGDYLTEHQPIKTINGESVIGSGNLEISADVTDEQIASAVNSYLAANPVEAYVDYDRNVHSVNHRGYSSTAPENTLPAYIMSRKKGFTYVEADISFTSDGVPVLLHDATIDRTSNGSGNISEMTFLEASQYDYGSWKNAAYAGTRIPTFEEFLTLCKQLCLHPYIELKDNGSYTQEQIQSLVDFVKSCGMQGKVSWISFSLTFLGYVKNADPTARLGYLSSSNVSASMITKTQELQTGENEVFLDLKYSNISDAGIALAVEAGIPLEVWTVNSESAMLALNPYVTGITSDNLIGGQVLYNSGLEYEYGINTVNTYTITNTLTNVTTDNTTESVLETESYTANLTVADGCTLTSVVVTMGGTDVTADAYADGVVTIASVTGDVAVIAIASADVTSYAIAQSLTNVTSSNSNTSVDASAEFTTTLTADDGYTLSSISVSMGGTDITADVYTDGVVTIVSVTGDVVIIAVATAEPTGDETTYSVTQSLTNVTTSNEVTSVDANAEFTTTLTADDGYALTSVVVTMGGTDVTADAYADGVVTISSVTGNVVIAAVASAVITSYSVTQSLSNVTSSNEATSVDANAEFTTTLTAATDYELSSVVVTMGGTDITADVYADGVVAISVVTGDVIIIASATAVGGEDSGDARLVYNWDLTQSLVDTVNNAEMTLSGATQDSSGLHLATVSDYAMLPDDTIDIGTIIELDIAEHTRQGSSHGRLVMMYQSGSCSAGFIYRSTGVWSVYSKTDSAWADSDITDSTYFNGKTVTVKFIANDDAQRVMEVYDGTKLIASGRMSGSTKNGVYIGSDNGQVAYNTTITAVRVYKAV